MYQGADDLVIVGNGFDLHHGLKSSYQDYKNWLQHIHPDLLDNLNRYIDTSGDWWNDFEGNLAHFDIISLIRESPQVSRPLDSRFPPTITSSAESFFLALRKQIINTFQDWVRSISLESLHKSLDISASGFYISFNYTDTLEKVYGIPENRILYIHGKVLRGNKLIFGHCKSRFEIEWDYMKKSGLRHSVTLFDYDHVISSEESQIVLAVSFFDKFPYTQIFENSQILMPVLQSANTVISYGLSFSEPDYEYLEWIVEQNPKMRWKVSWHTEEDKEKVDLFFKTVGFTKYSTFFL